MATSAVTELGHALRSNAKAFIGALQGSQLYAGSVAQDNPAPAISSQTNNTRGISLGLSVSVSKSTSYHLTTLPISDVLKYCGQSFRLPYR